MKLLRAHQYRTYSGAIRYIYLSKAYGLAGETNNYMLILKSTLRNANLQPYKPINKAELLRNMVGVPYYV